MENPIFNVTNEFKELMKTARNNSGRLTYIELTNLADSLERINRALDDLHDACSDAIEYIYDIVPFDDSREDNLNVDGFDVIRTLNEILGRNTNE